jgi:hypothetical protein
MPSRSSSESPQAEVETFRTAVVNAIKDGPCHHESAQERVERPTAGVEEVMVA